MGNLKKKLLHLIRESYDFTTDLLDLPGTEDPLMIQPYRGYASRTRLHIQGRVLEDEEVLVNKSDTEIINLLNSFKRFESDEAPGMNTIVRFREKKLKLVTDREGYFIVHTSLEPPLELKKEQWLPVRITLPGIPSTDEDDIRTDGEVLFPDPDAEFGIITDIDDTVLQTHITSLFRLKMMYASLLKNAHQRLPMEGIPELLTGLTLGSDPRRRNPVFYVSNSPWNIYDVLEEFLDLQELPKGPIFLRDIDLLPQKLPKGYRGHKIETITGILDDFPNMPFIMLGDTGSEDADVYLEMAREYPEQVLDIYIRNTKDTRNARRVEALIREAHETNITMIKTSADIVEDVLKKGYMTNIEVSGGKA